MTIDLKAIRAAAEAAIKKYGGYPVTDPAFVIALLDRLEAAEKALAEPAVEPVVCTNKQAMEVRNSIGLMKNEDERNNYGNYATAIKVLEAFLASPHRQPRCRCSVMKRLAHWYE